MSQAKVSEGSKTTERMWRVLDPSARNALLVVGYLAAVVCAIAASLQLGSAISSLQGAFDLAGLLSRLGAALLLSVASAAIEVLLVRWAPARLSVRKARELTKETARDVLGMSQPRFSARESGYYVNLLSGSVPACGNVYAEVNVALVGSVLCVALVIAVALAINADMAVALIVYVPVFCVVVQAPARRLSRLQRDGVQTQDAWLGESKLAVALRRPIRALHAEAAFKGRYRERSASYLRFVISYRFNEQLVNGLPTVLCVLLQVSMMGIAALRAAQGAGGVGDILVAYQLSTLVQSPLATILQALSDWRANRVHLERLGEVADDGRTAPAAVEPPADDAALCEVSGRLDVAVAPAGEGRGTLFTTSGFSVRRGELVVIKGENGSGKSTLVDLLAGLGDPDSLAGDLRLSADLKGCAFLTYPVPILPGSFDENMLGQQADESVIDLLDAHDLARRTGIAGEDSLSLGERQKVGLIRTLSRPCDVVLLDEPLTNLDAATSRALCDYLARLRGTKTVVAIMHSADLDAAADSIWQISDRRLVRVK